MADLIPSQGFTISEITRPQQNLVNPVNHINPSVPRHLENKFLWLPDDARSMGIHIMAGKGSGKSRLMGRILCWLDFIRGVPLIILDPNGPSIDNFLDKICKLPPDYQKQLWKRVLYVDMSGKASSTVGGVGASDVGGHVVPFPLYYRLGQESLYEISQRYLDVVRKTDPFLATASVEGWNALWRIGTHAGMVLSALGCQITEADHLLHYPEAWSERFAEALDVYPEVAPAVEFFKGQYMKWDEKTRERRIDSFVNKIALFSLDPSMKAMFGAGEPGIDWQRVVEGGYTVLLDFRHEYDLERRRFKMLWAYNYFMEFIKARGAGHRHTPVSLVIDELASLLNAQSLTGNLFAQDLDELINVIARNYRVWLTIAHQEMFQLDERTQKTLMTMGTQIFGSTSDMDAALSLARHFFRIDPAKVKRYEPVYSSYQGVTEVIDERPVEYTIEEQQYLKSYEVKDQPAFHFLVRAAPREGDVTGSVHPITIRNFDKDMWVDEELVARARRILAKRQGIPVADALAEIEARLPTTNNRASASEKPATMNRYATKQTNKRHDHIPPQWATEGTSTNREEGEAEEGIEGEDILREEKQG